MAGNDLKKVNSGQPFSMKASTFNSFVDAAQDYRNRTLKQSETPVPKNTQSGIVRIRNDSGGDLNMFDVVGLDSVVIKPNENEPEFKHRFALTGVSPDKTKHLGRFGILREPIGSGKIGRAYVDDICPVMLLVEQGDEECRYAEMDDGQTAHLKARYAGSAAILWREGGTGLQWAVVRIGVLPVLFPVKLVTAGGTQGTDIEQATWIYDVIDIGNGDVLSPAADPISDPHKWQRPSVGWMIEATFGYAHYNDQGEIVLGWINEMVDQEKCEEEEGQ